MAEKDLNKISFDFKKKIRKVKRERAFFPPFFFSVKGISNLLSDYPVAEY